MSETYRALEYRLRPARVLWQRLLTSVHKSHLSQGVRLIERHYPLVDDRNSPWVPVAPLLSGICGSDIAILRGTSSPYLAPLASFPAVLGHEVVARRLNGANPGERVVVDPTLSCSARGVPACLACQRGETDECENRTVGALGPGLLMGYTRATPGGWSTRMWVPDAQLIPIPQDLPNQRAVLAEPTAIVWEGLRRVPLEGSHTVLIMGAGTLGLLALALIRHRLPKATVVVRSRYPMQSQVARTLGGNRILEMPSDAAFLASPDLRDIVGKTYPGMWGALPYHTGGFDLTIDSVGRASTIAQALTLTRPGGSILLIGGANTAAIDFTPLWSRRLTLVGTFGYAHGHRHSTRHTFLEALEWLRMTVAPLEQLVTHQFPLEDYREAFRVLEHRSSGAIKVAFAPNH
ncbi:MAG: alcohol dehydrogenase catalytic domain-containing protein [Firmicutes bacterium]|nr:alcohol dehydrogenase catalytic domain-containing protein [Bacillota bacterium]